MKQSSLLSWAAAGAGPARKGGFMKRFAILAALVLIFVGSASAETYRYVDDKGELHFVDDIAKVPKKYRKQVSEAGSEGT